MSETIKVYGEDASEVPCCQCKGPVVEFYIPNHDWNRIVRKGGGETGREYLCWACFESKVVAAALSAKDAELAEMREAARVLAEECKAAQELRKRLGECYEDPRYNAVWTLYHTHGGTYTGPFWTDEQAKYDEVAEVRKANPIAARLLAGAGKGDGYED